MPPLSRLRNAAHAFAEILLLQRKTWRYAGHVLLYLLLLVLSAWLIQPLKQLDWRLADALDLRSEHWPANVEIVDLGWNRDPATLEAFRADLAAALTALAALPQGPGMVVVDVALTTLPLGLPRLKDAVVALDRQRIDLVAVADAGTFSTGVTREEGLARHGAGTALYAGRALFGHTDFHFNGNSFWYAPCEALPLLALKDCLPAVPYIVGEKRSKPGESFKRPPADAPPVLFQPGAPGLLAQHAWQLKGGQLAALPPNSRDVHALAHAVVIVGNLEHDQVAGRPGPEILAWAIGAGLMPSPPYAPRLVALTDPRWALGLALLFSAVALAVFVLLRRLPTMEHRLAVVGATSVVLTLALLALVVLGLRHGLHAVYSQVSYVVVAVGLTVALACHATRSNLRDEALYSDIEGPDARANPKHDVFISYSHTPFENIAWVERELAAPLKAAKLDVFFDKKSLHPGTAWYFDLARAIERSRCLVAVCSSDYFSKSFCTFELGKAAIRQIRDKDRSFRIVPLMRGEVTIPPDFNHLQFAAAATSDEMVALVLRALEELRAKPG